MPAPYKYKSVTIVTTEFLLMPQQRVYTVPILPGWDADQKVRELRKQFGVIKRYPKCHAARVRLKEGQIIITVRVKEPTTMLWMNFEARIYTALRNGLNVPHLERYTTMDFTTVPQHD